MENWGQEASGHSGVCTDDQNIGKEGDRVGAVSGLEKAPLSPLVSLWPMAEG